MSFPSGPYFHGTSKEHAENIVENGVNLRRTQSRDRGFFGDGFYVAAREDIAMQHATTVGPSNPAIVEVSVSGADVLYAGETFDEGTVRPTAEPSWHEAFIDWSIGNVEDAAVWEYATDRSKEDIMSQARAERTPTTDAFDREKWYNEVTEYAEAHGYDIVYWTDGEIIIKNAGVVSNLRIV